MIDQDNHISMITNTIGYEFSVLHGGKKLYASIRTMDMNKPQLFEVKLKYSTEASNKDNYDMREAIDISH